MSPEYPFDETATARAVIDESGTLVEWNAGAEQLLGWPVTEVVGRPGRDLLIDRGVLAPAGARWSWVQYLPCTAYEKEHPAYCTQPDRDRTALHLDTDYLHFCLAPTTSTPRPCPVRSPGILRIAREITRVIGRTPAG